MHIWDWEWKCKRNIIKSVLLNRVGKSEKIYARNCIVKEVSNQEKTKFLELAGLPIKEKVYQVAGSGLGKVERKTAFSQIKDELNQMIEGWEKVLNEVQDRSRARFLVHSPNTRVKYPLIHREYTDMNIYSAFIYYLNFNFLN